MVANIFSIVFGIIAQASMMVYGFGFLKPLVKKNKIEVDKKAE